MDNDLKKILSRLDELEVKIANHQHAGFDGSSQIRPFTRWVTFRVMDSSVSHSVASFGGDFECPVSGAIVEIGAWVDTAGTTNAATIDVNKNGTTLMGTTKITIDDGEKTSRTAATKPVLSVTNIDRGDIITVDVDAIQTTPAKGLTIFFRIDNAI